MRADGCSFFNFILNSLNSTKEKNNNIFVFSSLSKIKDYHEALNLIEKMIGSEPSLRPPASAVLKHPMFWSKDKVLTFLQDVSDRVDKEDADSALLAALERNR